MDTSLVGPLASVASGLLAGTPAWLQGMVVDGLIGGVGSVFTFLPILVIFFAAFAFLEDVGYMARAAFVMDNLMHTMGLHGRSFLPLFLGFGCNVPAVMGTRVIDSWPARLLTILIAPLVPCTARMAVVAYIAPIFFGANAVWVSWGLVLLALLALVSSGALLNRVIFKGERSAFIMEIPLYHIPNPRTIGLLVWQRAVSFIKKAGTVILVMSAAIWALSYFPGGNLETSFLAKLGSLLAPVGGWMGMDWRLTVALLTSFLAKENSVATLGVMFGSGESSGLAQTLAATYSPAAGLAFLVVSLLFIPCAATVAVIRQETGSWRWTLLNIALMLAISLAAGVAVLFGVNTVTGVWNLWEGSRNPSGRTKRLVHGILMLCADAARLQIQHRGHDDRRCRGREDDASHGRLQNWQAQKQMRDRQEHTRLQRKGQQPQPQGCTAESA